MSTPRAMVSPLVDALAVGGASLVALPLMWALMARPWHGGALFVGGILINWPHFIASYRVLYATPGALRKHPFAALWIPAALAAFAVMAVVMSPRTPLYGNLVIVAGGLYLARHYTGQAWGMMASFAFVAGVRFEERERRLVRLGLALAMGWHLTWTANQSIALVSPAAHPWAALVYERAWLLLAGGFASGAVGLGLCARRTQKLPAGVWLPWLALFAWYVAMAVEPSALLLAQLGHAAQYLMFPARVEVNRTRARLATAWWWWAAWCVVGLAVFEGLEPLLALGGAEAAMARTTTAVVISAISIHHYFIDGALYKLRNPEVRQALFAHLTQS